MHQGKAAVGGVGLGADLQTILNSFGGKYIVLIQNTAPLFTVTHTHTHTHTHLLYLGKSSSYGTGSRFQHTEKFQFAKVSERAK